MTRRRWVVPDLPTFVDDEYNSRAIRAVLQHTGTQLLDEFRSTTGHEREAVRERLRRFREETLAGLIDGPHVPMGEAAAAALRASAERIDLMVVTGLSEP
ncbi:hypothetical protein [Actinophytocola sp.]|uniref:hypothetical protein n=1 Tax=Actinophytocola sp. TaxID=1872138 RepID=UPI002D388AE1|nr:hypothetical protein [Actinophytocola sp.]HYQ65895.1 hypothetical protein [Actinophytocola sp.]